MYKSFIKPFLFLFAPEAAHHLTFKLLKLINWFLPFKWVINYLYNSSSIKNETKLFGLTFPNKVGLAAGLDKNALCIDELSLFGFGFIEIGTVTPLPQAGNEQPRLFRLPIDNALINRMGFNNDGVAAIVNRLKKRKSKIIIGGNIGKNKMTPNENAAQDYALCFEALYDYVDYFVVNVSSPNTPGLRDLQEKEPLTKLLFQIQQLNNNEKTKKPLLLKIAPDLTNNQLDDIIEIANNVKLDGIIACNTTIDRSNLKTADTALTAIGNGGLSGEPLQKKSNQIISYLSSKINIPIIGSGGIMTAQDAIDKLDAGAALVQVYTGFVYNGPQLIKEINLLEKTRN
jgi:dihydroorotate dehydrogenase